MLFLPCVETNITAHTLGTTLHAQKSRVFSGFFVIPASKAYSRQPFCSGSSFHTGFYTHYSLKNGMWLSFGLKGVAGERACIPRTYFS